MEARGGCFPRGVIRSTALRPTVLYYVKNGKVVDPGGRRVSEACYSMLGVTKHYVLKTRYAEITDPPGLR